MYNEINLVLYISIHLLYIALKPEGCSFGCVQLFATEWKFKFFFWIHPEAMLFLKAEIYALDFRSTCYTLPLFIL